MQIPKTYPRRLRVEPGNLHFNLLLSHLLDTDFGKHCCIVSQRVEFKMILSGKQDDVERA